MSQGTKTSKPNSPRVEITTGVFSGKISKRMTGTRWAIGPAHQGGMWTPFAVSFEDPTTVAPANVLWINKAHWAKVCDKAGKPTPEQSFTTV